MTYLPILCALALGGAAMAQPYSFQGLPMVTARGISADGTRVVGIASSRPATWNAADGLVLLPPMAGTWSFGAANDISDDGQTVIGTWSNIQPVNDLAFRWTAGGGYTPLPPVGGMPFSDATRTSSNGAVTIGGSRSADLQSGYPTVWRTGQPPAFSPGLSDIDATGTVGCGIGYDGSGQVAQRCVLGGSTQYLGRLPGHTDSQAFAITRDGSQVFGSSYGPGIEPRHVFRWDSSSGLVDLGTFTNHFDSRILSVSDDGSVGVGFAQLSNLGGPSIGLLWLEGRGFMRAQDLLTELGLDLTGWTELSWVSAVSGDGRTITGTGLFEYFPGFTRQQAFVATIPAPGVPVLGALLLFATRRRRAVHVAS